MIRLLEGSYQKMEKIINILSISEKWMTKKELAIFIESSESTVIRYLKEIRTRWGNSINIEVSHKSGYRIKYFNVSLYLKVLAEMLQQSTNGQLLHEIILNPGKPIEYYCEKIYISRSSFTRRLKQCNKILSSYFLKIIVNQGYQLISLNNALQLKIFITFFFLTFYGSHALPFQLEKPVVKKIMTNAGCQLNVISNDNTYEHNFFIMYFIVYLMKEAQDNPSTNEPDSDYMEKKSEYFFFRKCFSNLSYISYSKTIHYFKYDLFKAQTKDENRINKMIRKNLSPHNFSYLGSINSKKYSFIADLLTTLYRFSQLFPFDITSMVHRATYFSMQIKHADPSLYSCIQQDLEYFSTLLDPDTNLSNYFSFFIFWLLNNTPETNLITASKKILVISDLGINHSQQISSYISNVLALFKLSAYTETITKEQLSAYKLEDFDLIVTNQPLKDTTISTFLINDTISLSNISHLSNLFGM